MADMRGGLRVPDGVTPPEDGIHVTERSERSLMMHIIQLLITPIKSHIIKPGKVFPAGSPQLTPTRKARKSCKITERRVNDIWIYDVVSATASAPAAAAAAATTKAMGSESKDDSQSSEKPDKSPVNKRRIYYFAGGGWQMPANGEHWSLISEMARRLPGTTISLISYPLAPINPAPITYPILEELYLKLLSESAACGETVILGGDSAGGNIALCLATATLCATEENPAPVAIMAICPSTDLRRHNPQIKIVAKHDPLLSIPFINSTARAWCGGDPSEATDPKPNSKPNKQSRRYEDRYSGVSWDAGDPRVSPIRADLKPLARKGVKVHGLSGTHDILAPDAVLFREKCREAGIQGEWLSWEKQMHCFPLAFSYGLKESIQAVDWIIDVLDRT